MNRALLLSILVLGALNWCDLTGLASAKTSERTEIGFPAATPRWLVAATDRTAQSLGDPAATLIDMRLGRFPVVVIHGTFRCDSCSRPPGAAVPTGHFASITFDAVTHRLHDLALSPHRPGRLSALCSGDCASRRRAAFASAQQALDAARIPVTLGIKHGSHRCLLPTHTTNGGLIAATCTLSIKFANQRTLVTFTEKWTGLDSYGRRYAADSPTLHHTWRIFETPDAFVTEITSTGDRPPR